MQKDVAALLFDKDGKIKPFHAFQKDVEPVIGKYRKDWLRTEYATAIQRSRIAAQWQQFSDEADVFPNLEWVQSTSAHPGADHQIFWGVIQPVNAPFGIYIDRVTGGTASAVSVRPTRNLPTFRQHLSMMYPTLLHQVSTITPGKMASCSTTTTHIFHKAAHHVLLLRLVKSYLPWLVVGKRTATSV